MKHPIYDHKILTLFVPFFLLTLLLAIAGVAFILVGIDSQSAAGENITAALTILFTVLLQLAYEWRVKGEVDSSMVWSTTGLLIALPALCFAACNFIGFEPSYLEKMNPIPWVLLMAASPGVSEEIIFRGIPTSNWMRLGCDSRSIISSTVATSLAFSLVHGMNSLLGAAISTTIFQLFYSMCLGIVFNAVYLNCGSILPSIIMHTLIDFTGYLFISMESNGILTNELSFGFSFWATLAMSILMLAWGIYLLRPSKSDQIIALWQKKCHRA